MCRKLGIENELVPRIATPFAGGMGRSGEVCGAVVGALMCIGIKHGREEPGQWQQDDAANALTQRFLPRLSRRDGQHRLPRADGLRPDDAGGPARRSAPPTCRCESVCAPSASPTTETLKLLEA